MMKVAELQKSLGWSRWMRNKLSFVGSWVTH